jgi:hypothetical protein
MVKIKLSIMNENELLPQEDIILSTTYILGPDPAKQIFISLEIGENGQHGNSVIDVLGQEHEIEGTVENHLLGTAGELNLKSVLINTVVVDMPNNANHATLTITLEGGVEKISYPLGKFVDEGGTAIFSAKILFFIF